MLNIVVPMAGAGSRFANVGYKEPKPLISIHGVPMIKWVIANLCPKTDHRFVFICQNKHDQYYGLFDKLKVWAPGCEVVGIDGITEGAACTVMAAQHLINNNDGLMIANSDQFIVADINQYLRKIEQDSLDGLIMTMGASDPKWSYVAVQVDGYIGKVVEKMVISNEATVGIYNFKRGSDFVMAAQDMIRKNLRVNNEYYVAPTYNELIEKGFKIGYHNIGKEGNGMYGLGIPEDLNVFTQSKISQEYLSNI